MTKSRPQVLSLNRGEADGEAIARSDMDSYASTAAFYENALPAVKGGLFRAPGTRHLGQVLSLGPGADLEAVVRPWRYSRRQAFTLEVCHEAIRLVYGAGYVQTAEAVGAFGVSWTDTSTGGASADSVEPSFPASPFDPEAPPATGGGGTGGGGGGGFGSGGGGLDLDPDPGIGGEGGSGAL